MSGKSILGLQKNEYVSLHRELWGWLSENPDKSKEEWTGWEKFDPEEVNAYTFCFACAFTDISPCRDCLLIWEGEGCCNIKPFDCNGLFKQWEYEEDFPRRTSLAAKIRDLPVREG